MKKLSLLLTFSLAILFSVKAQENSNSVFIDTDQENDGKNWFLGAGVRGNVWVNNNAKDDIKVWEKPSLGGEVFLGKWFSHKVGARLFVDGGTLHPFFKERTWMEDEKYIAGRVDFLLNFTNLFRSFSPNRFYNLIPYVGIGGANSFNADYIRQEQGMDKKKGSSSFMFGGGLWNTFRLSDHFDLYVNLGLDVLNANFDGWKDKDPTYSLGKSSNQFDGLASASIGLVYNFGKSSKKEIIAPPVFIQEEQPIVRPEPQPEPQPQPQPEPPKVVEPVKVVLDPVFFRIDKSIIDADQEIKIQQAADFLKANPSAKLNVVGYADVETAYPKYNLALSERRAKAVANQLVKKYGISSDRLKLDWKGDTVQPFAINDKNRVVMFSE